MCRITAPEADKVTPCFGWYFLGGDHQCWLGMSCHKRDHFFSCLRTQYDVRQAGDESHSKGGYEPSNQPPIRRCWVRDVGTDWALDGLQAGKGALPLLVTGWNKPWCKMSLDKSISQAWKRDLGNCRQILLLKKTTYCLVVNSCLNYFFFSWTSDGFRRTQPGNTLPTIVMHNPRAQPWLRGLQPQSPALPPFASICMDDIRREVLCLSVTDIYAFPRTYFSIKPG